MADDKKHADDSRLKQLEDWVSKQCFPVQAGFIFHHVLSMKEIQFDQEKISHLGVYRSLVLSMGTGTRFDHVRNLAVLHGVNPSVSCLVKKLTGDDDVCTSMVSGFGSGVILSPIAGMRGPAVVSVGSVFVLVGAVHFKVQEFSWPKAQDVLNDGLGVDHHEMNFNTGLFTTNALSPFNDTQELLFLCLWEGDKEMRQTSLTNSLEVEVLKFTNEDFMTLSSSTQ